MLIKHGQLRISPRKV